MPPPCPGSSHQPALGLPRSYGGVTQCPAPSHSPPLQGVPEGSWTGAPLSHEARVHSVGLGRSVLSSSDRSSPLPSQTITRQSPEVWRSGDDGVPSSATALPQRPFVQVATSHTSNVSRGQSSAFAQPGGVGQGATQKPRVPGVQQSSASPETPTQNTPGMAGKRRAHSALLAHSPQTLSLMPKLSAQRVSPSVLT